MIKKIIAYIPCNVFYYLGDAVSKLIDKIPDEKGDGDKFYEIVYHLYLLYSGFMLWSSWWNDFGGLNLWTKTNLEDL